MYYYYCCEDICTLNIMSCTHEDLNPFHTRSIFLEFVHQIMGWLQPAHDLMNKFKKNSLFGHSEQLSVKYFQYFQYL